MDNHFTLATITTEYSEFDLGDNYGSGNVRSNDGCDDALIVMAGALLETELPRQLVYACQPFEEEGCKVDIGMLPLPPNEEPILAIDTPSPSPIRSETPIPATTTASETVGETTNETTSSATCFLCSAVSFVALLSVVGAVLPIT